MNVHWNVVVAKVLSVESHTLNVEWGNQSLTPLTSPPPTFSWASLHIEEDVLGWWEWVIRQILLHRTSIHASSGESPNMNFWTQKCANIYSEVWELVLTLCLKKQKPKKQKTKTLKPWFSFWGNCGWWLFLISLDFTLSSPSQTNYFLSFEPALR